jgi:hypothetical protein
MNKLVGGTILFLTVSGFAFGAVPEIPTGSAVSAVALLSGALLVIRGRRKK